jgi:hypothetical protein
VEGSWNKEKLVNIFVIKKTPLALLLSRTVRYYFAWLDYFQLTQRSCRPFPQVLRKTEDTLSGKVKRASGTSAGWSYVSTPCGCQSVILCVALFSLLFKFLRYHLQGKDEALLCSLSNFDVYHVSKLHKAPKPYVFAVKSADNLSLFENASDYVHFFSCGQKEGETWMQAILLARVFAVLLSTSRRY